jgi:hypothetical protein
VLILQANGSFSYTPNADLVGNDKFTFTVSDGSATSAAAEVSITIDLLQVKFSEYSRKAFTQGDVTAPLVLDSRNMTQDVSDETAYDDLLTL